MYNPELSGRRPGFVGTSPRSQRGVSLVELLVGLTIGLLVIAAAIGTLVISRSASSTVSDASQLQQQGAYALRTMGMQMRQAGSIELMKVVAPQGFEFNNEFSGVAGAGQRVTGLEGAGGAPDTVTISNQPSQLASQARDCLGNSAAAGLGHIDSSFFVENGQLYCLGTNAASGKQSVIGNVADFQVRYRLVSGAAPNQTTRLLTADEVPAAGGWASVNAVETCLDLQGNDTGQPASGNYINCQGATTARNGRLHLVLRNVFNLRTGA